MIKKLAIIFFFVSLSFHSALADDKNKSSEISQKKGIVTGTKVNVRSTPGLYGTIINNIKEKGTIVKVNRLHDNWFNISINGVEGWIHKNYILLKEETDTGKGEETDTVKKETDTGKTPDIQGKDNSDESLINIDSHEDKLFGKYTTLAQDTGYLIVPAIAVLGLLYVAPESVSNWDEDDKDLSLNRLGKKWWDNVKDGPVWDKDDFAINYIGHPYWGSAYYIHSRHYGYSKLESFFYSAFISTFMYEYGIEAFAEEPSVQDILSTPIGGFLLGELLLPIEEKIHSWDDKVLGSKIIGTFCLVVIDPIGYIIRPIRYMKNKWFDGGKFQSGLAKSEAPLQYNLKIDNKSFHFQFSIPFN